MNLVVAVTTGWFLTLLQCLVPAGVCEVTTQCILTTPSVAHRGHVSPQVLLMQGLKQRVHNTLVGTRPPCSREWGPLVPTQASALASAGSFQHILNSENLLAAFWILYGEGVCFF